MNNKLSLIPSMCVIVAVILSGCTDTVGLNSAETQLTTIGETTKRTETTEATKTESASEKKPSISGDLSEKEAEELIDYVNELSNKIYFEFPLFDDINDVPLLTLLLFKRGTLPEADLEYTELQSNELFNSQIYTTDIKGYSPETIENYLKETLNPNFSIGSYDYENYDSDFIIQYKWDSKRKLMAVYIPPHGPQLYLTLAVTDIQKSGDDYYVYASSFRSFWNEIEYSFNNLKYHFKKNENGLFNIYSIEQNGDEKPEYIKAVDKFFSLYDENELNKYDKLAFSDIDNDGNKDVVLKYTDYNREKPEFDNAVIYLDTGKIEFGVTDNEDLSELIYYEINSYSYTLEIYYAFINYYNDEVKFYAANAQ